MIPRLLADEDTAHAFVSACVKLDRAFPIIHIAKWLDGRCLGYKDTQLLAAALKANLVLVSFDRSTLAHHAGQLTKTGEGHAGVILFRRSVLRTAFGHQAGLLVEFWREAAERDWMDLIAYLPR